MSHLPTSTSIPDLHPEHWKTPLSQPVNMETFSAPSSLDTLAPPEWLSRWSKLPTKQSVQKNRVLQRWAIQSLNNMQLEQLKWLKHKGLSRILPSETHDLKEHQIEKVFLNRFFQSGFHEPGPDVLTLTQDLKATQHFYASLKALFDIPTEPAADPEQRWLQLIFCQTSEEFQLLSQDLDWVDFFHTLLNAPKNKSSLLSPLSSLTHYDQSHRLLEHLGYLFAHHSNIYSDFYQAIERTCFEQQPFPIEFLQSISRSFSPNELVKYFSSTSEHSETQLYPALKFIDQFNFLMNSFLHHYQSVDWDFLQKHKNHYGQITPEQQQMRIQARLDYFSTWRPALKQIELNPTTYNSSEEFDDLVTGKPDSYKWIGFLRQAKAMLGSQGKSPSAQAMEMIYQHLYAGKSYDRGLIEIYEHYFQNRNNETHYLLSNAPTEQPLFEQTLQIIYQSMFDHAEHIESMHNKNGYYSVNLRIAVGLDLQNQLKQYAPNTPEHRHLQSALIAMVEFQTSYWEHGLFHFNKPTFYFLETHFPSLLKVTGQHGASALATYLRFYPERKTEHFALTPLLEFAERNDLFHVGEPSIETLLQSQLGDIEKGIMARWTERYLKRTLETPLEMPKTPPKKRL